MTDSKILKVYKPGYHALKTDLNSIDNNSILLFNYKEQVISELEGKKINLRQRTDCNQFYINLKHHKRKIPQATRKVKKIIVPIISTVTRDKILSSLDRDISLIQNHYDVVYNDLKKLKTNLEERITIIDQTELIMNILNYKIYEIRYNFRKRTDELKEIKDKVAADLIVKGESQVALELVELDKEIVECEHLHESQMQCVKQQKLEAQKQYEDAVNVLDTNLETMRRYFNILLLLVEAEKAQLTDSQNEIADAKYSPIMEELQKEIDAFTELQTVGWKTKKIQEGMSALSEERGLTFTASGLLITKSGERITYEEAWEKKLLDNISFLDFFKLKVKEDEKSTSSKQSKESNTSDYSRMTSEDVQYLKENLGTPLTLALAEITAVQPKDPIHYLGHWLFKYRYNQEVSEMQRIEVEQLTNERERLAKERWHKFIEEEARAAVLEMILRAEEQAIRNELLRIQRELEAMENEEEHEENYNLDDEARDKFGTYDTPAT